MNCEADSESSFLFKMQNSTGKNTLRQFQAAKFEAKHLPRNYKSTATKNDNNTDTKRTTGQGNRDIQEVKAVQKTLPIQERKL